MKIGIIGSGNIGGSLGRLWAAAGHEVCFGSRDPESLSDLVAKAGANAQAATQEEAAAFGDVVLEAIPFHAVPELPHDSLAGKVVLSASNYYPERDGEINLGGRTQSEWVASHLPQTRLVKAFNMMQAGVMEELADGGGTPGLAIFLASDDDEAKQTAAQLVRDAKFEPVDAGTLAESGVFQATDAPLYDVQISGDEARRRLSEQRA